MNRIVELLQRWLRRWMAHTHRASARQDYDRKLMARLQEAASCDGGQTTLLVCLSMMVLVGILGLAIDVDQLRYTKSLQDESGSEVLEFALSAVLVLMVLFGIMDCSRAVYVNHFLAQAARDAAPLQN